jgi:hypothetical protein
VQRSLELFVKDSGKELDDVVVSSNVKVSAGALGKARDPDDGKGDIARLRVKLAKITKERDALKAMLAIYLTDDSCFGKPCQSWSLMAS